MENKMNISNFYYDRFIKYLIFNNEEMINMKNGKYDNSILTQYFVKHLNNFIENLSKLDYLERSEIDTIYDIVNYLKCKFPYKDSIEKSKYKEEFNSIISALNLLESKGVEEFYFYEFAKRLLCKKMSIFERNTLFCINMIKESLSADFMYLNYAFGYVSNEEFEENLPILASDIYYFMFLNSLLFEDDELLSSKTLIERTKKIIECKNMVTEIEIAKDEKKLVKKYKRYYKTVLDLY